MANELTPAHEGNQCCKLMLGMREALDEVDVCGSAGIISPKTDAAALLRLVTSSWMSLFLVAVPLGFCAQFLGWGSIAIFVLVRLLSALLLGDCHVGKSSLHLMLMDCRVAVVDRDQEMMGVYHRSGATASSWGMPLCYVSNAGCM